MAKGPGVSATSHIIATSQTNAHYYIKNEKRKQEFFQLTPKTFPLGMIHEHKRKEAHHQSGGELPYYTSY
jgi:hypothetical protein